MAISVIIPTYQSPDSLNLCLESAIKGQNNKNEIIIVIDGFYNLNQEVLKKWKDDILILNLEQNVGLCRGTNLGVYNASNDAILIVNDDNVFPQDWDVTLENAYHPDKIISPNQIEPYPSMFNQFVIEDLGRDPLTFDLKRFWEYSSQISQNLTEDNGSTLPIFMSKQKYIALGGWDENYEQGMVGDWDFFLKCKLLGLDLIRTYACHFYHFTSISVKGEIRKQAEIKGHEYAKYKWGSYIKHSPLNNLKYL
jgi:glycosyltransferase involved in cell wall biosynthesis